MESAKKQLTVRKALPRGKPWPPGVSGNTAGRPPGAKNKITLALIEGARRAVAELSKPLTLDTSRHFETWGDCYIQDGIRFRRDNLLRVNPNGPVPTRPERLNLREVRQEVIWRRKRYWGQRGWLFSMETHFPVDL